MTACYRTRQAMLPWLPWPSAPLRENRPSNSMRIRILFLVLVAVMAASAWGQMPEGPGKQETVKLCTQCHELERSLSLHQDRAGWQATVNKMVTLGARGSEKDFELVVDYLAKNYPAPEGGLPKINVNQCRAIDLESGLSLRRSQAAAIIEYREKNGPFKSIDDLKKVPGVDTAKIEAKKDRLAF